MEENRIKVKNPWVKAMLAGFGALASAILLYLALIAVFNDENSKSILNILRPFFIGLALSYLICPVCDKIENALFKSKLQEKPKLVHFISITVSMLILALIVAILIVLIVPQTYDSIMTLVDTLPDKMKTVYNSIKEKIQGNTVLLEYWNNLYSNISSGLPAWLKDSVLPDISGIITGVGSGVLSAVIVLKDILIGIFVAVYSLSCRHTFKRQAKMILYSISGNRLGDLVCEETSYANKMFTGFLVGKFIDSAIIGVLCYIFCFIAKMPNAVLVSVIVGVTNIIPFFGPFIGAIPSGLLILIDDPMKAVIFAIFILILQQMDGNIIGPKILGDSVGLSSFWILFSIIIFGGLFGFVGMIIGVPLFAVIYDIIRKLVYKGLEKHEVDESKYLKKE